MKKLFLASLIVCLSILHVNAHVAIVHPSGGEVFYPGEMVTIEWEVLVAHNTLNWDLYLSVDGGITWDILQLDLPVQSLTYEWVVPNMPTSQARIRIVQDNEGEDYSDSSLDFTISNLTDISEDYNQVEAKVYPNPMITHSTIEFYNPAQLAHHMYIYNSMGIQIKSILNISNETITIYREGLRSGQYFFVLYRGREIHSSGKLMVN